MSDDPDKEKRFLLDLLLTLQTFKNKFVMEKISDNFYVYKQLDLLQEVCDEFIRSIDEQRN